jgi:hypothetical protein
MVLKMSIDKKTQRAIDRQTNSLIGALKLKAFASIQCRINRNYEASLPHDPVDVVDMVRKDAIDWLKRQDIDIIEKSLILLPIFLGTVKSVIGLSVLEKPQLLSAVLDLDTNDPFIIKLSELLEKRLNELETQSNKLVNEQLSDKNMKELLAVKGAVTYIKEAKEDLFKKIEQNIAPIKEDILKKIIQETNVKEIVGNITKQIPNVTERESYNEYLKNLPDEQLMVIIEPHIKDLVDTMVNEQVQSSILKILFQNVINNILIGFYSETVKDYKAKGYDMHSIEDIAEWLDKKMKPKDIIDFIYKDYSKTKNSESARQLYYQDIKNLNKLIKKIDFNLDISKLLNLNPTTSEPFMQTEDLYKSLSNSFKEALKR